MRDGGLQSISRQVLHAWSVSAKGAVGLALNGIARGGLS